MADDVDTREWRIRTLNDAFRRNLTSGRVMITQGVADLGNERVAQVMQLVRTFDRFDPANDPHREHDFGAFELGRDRFFFKIDYYDLSLTCGSEDPSDPRETTRVLTVMLASEY